MTEKLIGAVFGLGLLSGSPGETKVEWEEWRTWRETSIQAPDRRAAAAQTALVMMVDKSPTSFAFEPAELVVRQGDVVKFVQAGVMPHNVEFRSTPAGTELGNGRMGPYLTAKGQTYEIVIDERFAPGEHQIVCTPHEMMGMKGKIVVEEHQSEGG